MAQNSFRKITLNNGLRIITVPQENTRTVTVLVLVGTGSKYETKETKGISHFVEHMFFKGTEKYPTPLAVAEVLDQVGGQYNAFTTEDYTGYYAKVDAMHFELALDWVADIFLHSKLPAKEVEKEKGVVLEELHMYYDTPSRHIENLWTQLLYGDQPAGWNIVGTAESVSQLYRANLIRYMKSQYTASNTVICVAGNIKTSDIVGEVKRAFAGISTSKPEAKMPVRDQQSVPQLLLEWRKTNQTNIAVGVRGYNLFHPMRFTQHLLGVILGGMMSSRLFGEVREKLGLAYDISTYSESNPDTGFLVTMAGVKNNSVKEALRVILKEYGKVKSRGIGKRELSKAKEYEKGKLALQLESSHAKASFYGTEEILGKPVLTPEHFYAKIDQVTTQHIRQVAQDIFCPAKINLVVIGPHRGQQDFPSLLRALSP